MKRWLGVLVVVSVLITPRPGHAWNHVGHGASAIIAYRAMAPAERDRIVALLKKHPEYDSRWMAEKPAGIEDEGEYLFYRAATWPDDVRPAPGQMNPYHHATWHYVNFPFKLGSTIDTSGPTPAAQIIHQLQDNWEAATDQSASAGDRAVALCWLMHLVGDVHQPLHTVALFTPPNGDNNEFPTFTGGDEGGNKVFVRNGRAALKLHKLWDDLLGESNEYARAADAADDVLQEVKRSDVQGIGMADFLPWAAESTALAAASAYQFHGKPIQLSLDARHAVKLPDGYLSAAEAIATRRVGEAGYRMSGLLAKVN